MSGGEPYVSLVLTLARTRQCIPDEITESQYQDSNTSELYHVGKIRMEGFNIISKHGCQSERAHPLGEGSQRCTVYRETFPHWTPILHTSAESFHWFRGCLREDRAHRRWVEGPRLNDLLLRI
jgi:hypothetical protein